MIIDQNIANELRKSIYNSANYFNYFYNEIKPFLPKNNSWFRCFYDENLDSISEDSKNLGENDSDICKLIQKDLIKEFIVYINQNSISLNSKLKKSIYETNEFLLNQKVVSLIEYATFFGSIQIFNYLHINGVELTSSLWLYSIHGKNSEIIHILEDNHVKILKEKEVKSDFSQITYEDCFLEAIKCHHNDVAFYFLNNYLIDQGKDQK